MSCKPAPRPPARTLPCPGGSPDLRAFSADLLRLDTHSSPPTRRPFLYSARPRGNNLCASDHLRSPSPEPLHSPPAASRPWCLHLANTLLPACPQPSTRRNDPLTAPARTERPGCAPPGDSEGRQSYTPSPQNHRTTAFHALNASPEPVSRGISYLDCGGRGEEDGSLKNKGQLSKSLESPHTYSQTQLFSPKTSLSVRVSVLCVHTKS